MIGQTLLHYHITDRLGAGGMGEVYRATDTKLGRDVAIKVLPAEVAQEPERLARFRREATLLAALNHPHIAAIHGLEEADGNPFLVLELVEGEDLAERLKRGPVPTGEALEIARQITEGLEEAHEKGIVHRDLKPANVKITPEGKVKILDFGIAKAWAGDPASGSSGNLSQSPTLAHSGTAVGVILGTAAYMSPEQARGRPVDKRADIWGFGCVLYEMLTGRRAFEGEDVSVTLAEVIRSEPDYDALPEDVPARVEQALRVCLQKDPRQRGGDVAAVRLALDGAFETSAGAPAADGALSPPAASRRALPWVAAVLLAAITGLAVWAGTRPEPPRVARFYLTPEDILFDRWWGSSVALSPDGENVVYVWRGAEGRPELRVRPLSRLASTTLVAGRAPSSPFFSPDGRQVGFHDLRANELLRVPAGGGLVSRIAALPDDVRGASWGADGTIVFSLEEGDTSALWRVPAVGGTPERLTTPDAAAGEGAHLWPEVLPGGEAVLFTIAADPIRESQIAVLSLDTGLQKVLLTGGSYARYAPGGHVLYGAAGAMWAIGFDLRRLETVGSPVPVLEGVQTERQGAMGIDLSDDGSLVFVEGGSGPPQRSRRSWVWVDRAGREEPVNVPPGPYIGASLSPDGGKLASGIHMVTDDDLTDQIVVLDLETGGSSQLTFEGSLNTSPVWSPDGTLLTFTSRRGGRNVARGWALHRKPSDGSGRAELLLERKHTIMPLSWSPDGRYLACYEIGPAQGIHVLSMEDGTASPFLVTDAREASPVFSPDGRFIAYTSNESGSMEVYVQPFPRTGGKWRISTEGGRGPRWSPTSKELFYQRGDQLIAVEYEDTPSFRPRSQTVLFSGDYDSNPNFPFYDVHPDGRRFLFSKVAEEDDDGPPERLVFIQNWTEELKGLAPAD